MKMHAIPLLVLTVIQTYSMQPSEQKKGSRIEVKGSRLEAAAQILRTVTAFGSDNSFEQELASKLEETKKLKQFDRFQYDKQLHEILEAKVISASAAKFQAAQALLESAKDQVKICCDNIMTFEQYKNPSEMKTALKALLEARELAIYAVGKRLCAANPNKFDVWCRWETDIDPALKVINQDIAEFIAKHNITEEMKTKEAHMPLNAP